MLNCKDATELCSQELERPLGIGEQLGLHVHLMMCSGCTNFRKQSKMLREVMGRYADGRAPSPEEDERKE